MELKFFPSKYEEIKRDEYKKSVEYILDQQRIKRKALLDTTFLFVSKLINKRRENFNKNLEIETNKKISLLKTELERDVNAYREAFDGEVRKESLKFVNNWIVAEIAEKLCSYLINSVSKTSRDSYKEHITDEVNFYVTNREVYGERLQCRKLKYNFEELGFENLNGMFDQAALALCISEAIVSTMRSKYEKDSSGTQYNLSIEYSYGLYPEYRPLDEYTEISTGRFVEAVRTGVVYTAINGNFVPAKKWGEDIASPANKSV